MSLKGVKVIELAGLAPAPFCGLILSDFGASVIRVDKIGSSTSIDCLSNGKKSLALDLKHPKGKDIFKKLCRNSDVLIEPFRSGVMESLSLGPNVLMEENPKLIYARLTGYGQSGSYSRKAGHDINYLSLSGLLSLFGRAHENPIFPANLAADFGGGGLMCALGITLALLERTRSGFGQIVDNSMVHGTAYMGSWLYCSQELALWNNKRGNNILDSGAHFYEVYKTKDDKYMSVGALEPQFYSELISGLELSEEQLPQFGDFESCKAILKEKFLEKTQAEWCKIFENKDACVTPVLSLSEAPHHEHNKIQGNFISVGKKNYPAPAPKLSRTPATSSQLQKRPSKGEHTREILITLGLESNEISKLEEQGVIECNQYNNWSKL